MADEAQHESGFVRIVISLDREPDEEGPDDEWLWAEPLSAGRFRVESPPFFAYGLSRGDIVRAVDGPEMPRVSDLEEKGGHRTLRLALDPGWEVERPEIQELLQALREMGCSWDVMPPQILTLDVPPELDVERVAERLQGPSDAGLLIWEWADPRPC